ncbi:MAG TPA: hypothetical protein VG028_05635 [Terriglobia bacterium]|nr:hypothetical protein [Terriglobia bacterium]
MTENKKMSDQIRVLKAAIRTLKINVDGTKLHLAALERQMKTIRQKK